MPVVNVRKVRVVMGQRLVGMGMGVWLAAIPMGIVAVLVVGIVPMRMAVQQRGVIVFVRVFFGQM